MTSLTIGCVSETSWHPESGALRWVYLEFVAHWNLKGGYLKFSKTLKTGKRDKLPVRTTIKKGPSYIFVLSLQELLARTKDRYRS